MDISQRRPDIARIRMDTNTALARREVLGDGHVKGSMLTAHIRWVEDQRTAELPRFWEALPAGVRQRLRPTIAPDNWYAFSDLMAVDRTIVDLFGSGLPTTLRELGAYSACINLSGIYRTFTRTDVHEFLENGARLHWKMQDFGSAQYIRTGTTSGKMVHSGYCSFSPLYCESACGFYREAVALHNVEATSLIETTCQCRGDESCTFVIRWR